MGFAYRCLQVVASGSARSPSNCYLSLSLNLPLFKPYRNLPLLKHTVTLTLFKHAFYLLLPSSLEKNLPESTLVAFRTLQMATRTLTLVNL